MPKRRKKIIKDPDLEDEISQEELLKRRQKQQYEANRSKRSARHSQVECPICQSKHLIWSNHLARHRKAIENPKKRGRKEVEKVVRKPGNQGGEGLRKLNKRRSINAAVALQKKGWVCDDWRMVHDPKQYYDPKKGPQTVASTSDEISQQVNNQWLYYR